MSSPVSKKRRKLTVIKKRRKLIKKDALSSPNPESIIENVLSFSYNIVRPLLRREDHFDSEWTVIEKGFKKTKPEEEQKISRSTLTSVLSRTREHHFGVLKTPLKKYRIRSVTGEVFRIYLKKESEQETTSSVKARGVIYTLLQLSKKQKKKGLKGVIAISTGNFAQILCYYGKKFRIPVTVVVPTTTPDEIVQMFRDSSSDHADDANSRVTVHVEGNNMLEAHQFALGIAKTKGLVYIDGNDNPDIILGQASLGIEMMEDIKPDVVVLPTMIDGCGLTTGIAAAIKAWNKDIKVYEVQAIDGNCSVRDIRTQTTSLNELEIPVKEYATYINSNGIRRNLIDKFLPLGKNWIEVQIATGILKEKNIDDSYAALGLAPFLLGGLDELKGKRIIIPVYGKMDFN